MISISKLPVRSVKKTSFFSYVITDSFDIFDVRCESKAFQLEYGWLQRSTQGVNFDIGSKISVDWVDLKMLTMISALIDFLHILRGRKMSEKFQYISV